MKEILTRVRNYFKYDRILLFGVIFLILFINTCNKRKGDEALKAQKVETKIWKDKYENEHITTTQVTLQKEEMKEKVDSISKILEIKPKTITRYIKAAARIDTVVKGQIKERHDTVWLDIEHYRIDTLKSLDFVDTSKVPPPLEIHAVGDSLSVAVNMNINVTDYYKRDKVLGLRIGKKRHYTDVTTDNRYVSFNGVESYKKVEIPKLKLRTGIGLGLNFNPLTGKVQPGFQIGAFLSR